MLISDVVVIGAGIAGMTAAIYLKQAGLKVIMIEKDVPGGQINKTSKITNYPGFSNIDGPTLSYNVFKQTQDLGIELRQGTVVDIINKKGEKEIITQNETIECKGIILSTGRPARKLGIKNEEKLIGNGISYCAICDGSFYKDKEVVVVGGGNSAFQNSLYLADIAKKVTIIHRREVFTANAELQEKVKNKDNIKIIVNENVREAIDKDGKLTKITLDNQELLVDGLFIFIGSEASINYPSIKFKQDNDYIVVNSSMKTNIKNIYACGDVIKKDLYQLSTAVGEGALAAVSLIKSIKKVN